LIGERFNGKSNPSGLLFFVILRIKKKGTRYKAQGTRKIQGAGPKAKKGTRLEGLLISQKFPLEIIIELYQISQNTFQGFSLYLHPLISIRSCSSTE